MKTDTLKNSFCGGGKRSVEDEDMKGFPMKTEHQKLPSRTNN